MYKEAKGTTEKSGGVDVLCIMFVTAAVFQFEISALNAEAPSNADEDNAKKTATGVCELTEFKCERKARDNRNKEVEWTYFLACS